MLKPRAMMERIAGRFIYSPRHKGKTTNGVAPAATNTAMRFPRATLYVARLE